MYGCRGFVAHHNTDIWGDTAPQELWIPGSFWVMGGAWLCTHIWTHYEYTGDTEFLKEMFPIMREAALFFLDFCIEYTIDGRTYLCTCPSVSPENTFILPNGEQGANSIGVTMDNQILRDLFTQCNKAAKILGIEDELDRQIQDACKRLIRHGSERMAESWSGVRSMVKKNQGTGIFLICTGCIRPVKLQRMAHPNWRRQRNERCKSGWRAVEVILAGVVHGSLTITPNFGMANRRIKIFYSYLSSQHCLTYLTITRRFRLTEISALSPLW